MSINQATKTCQKSKFNIKDNTFVSISQNPSILLFLKIHKNLQTLPLEIKLNQSILIETDENEVQKYILHKYFCFLPRVLINNQLIQAIYPNHALYKFIQIMTSQQPNAAVQLIAFDSNKNPYLTAQALALLPKLTTNNLHVIAVAGKYRTGKSYILNRVLLNRNNGFNVGHTINACTKGLWMWPQLVKLGQKDCLIIDTEGLGSLQQGESTDLKIFLLALLFSSHLIYNSAGSIDEQAIESLSLVIQLANVLQRQDRYDTQELVNTFPSFLWLLRDFSLKLEDDKGLAISPTDYLQNALRHQPRSTQAAERKNQIRKQLRTFFQDRDCFALVRPTEQQRDLQNLSTLQQSKLRPQFVKLISGLRTKLESTVKPKRVRGRILNTGGFIQLCQYFTKALVDGKLPTISSHWDNLCLGQTHRIFQKYQLDHIKALQLAQTNKGKLQNAHQEVVIAGLEAIQKSFLGKLQKQLFKERFQRKLQGQFNELKLKINSKKGAELKIILQNLDELKSKEGDFLERYEAVIQKMSQISETSNRDEGFYCQLYLYISEFARGLLQEAESKRFQSEKLVNQKMIFFEDQMILLRKEQTQQLIEKDKQIQQLKIALCDVKSRSNQSVKDNEQKLNAEIQKLRQSNQQITDKNKQLQQQMRIISQQIKQLMSQKSDYHSRIERLQQSLQEKDLQLIRKEQMLREQLIKSRKLLREKQIVKHRYQEYLQENLILRNNADQLQNKIAQLEKKQYFSSETEVNRELDQLRRSLRKSEEQRKSLDKFMNQQKIAYQAMIQVPQNIHLAAIKRNLQIEQINSINIQTKFRQLANVINLCESFSCLLCKQTVFSRMAKEHVKICVTKNSIDFDVSYLFTADEQIQFQISISFGDKQWKVIKTLIALKQLIIKLRIEDRDHLFQKQQIGENSINLNEQRRIWIDHFLHQSKHKIWEEQSLRQFLEIDDKIHSISSRNEQLLQSHAQSNNKQNLQKNSPFSMRSGSKELRCVDLI